MGSGLGAGAGRLILLTIFEQGGQGCKLHIRVCKLGYLFGSLSVSSPMAGA